MRSLCTTSCRRCVTCLDAYTSDCSPAVDFGSGFSGRHLAVLAGGRVVVQRGDDDGRNHPEATGADAARSMCSRAKSHVPSCRSPLVCGLVFAYFSVRRRYLHACWWRARTDLSMCRSRAFCGALGGPRYRSRLVCRGQENHARHCRTVRALRSSRKRRALKPRVATAQARRLRQLRCLRRAARLTPRSRRITTRPKTWRMLPRCPAWTSPGSLVSPTANSMRHFVHHACLMSSASRQRRLARTRWCEEPAVELRVPDKQFRDV